MGQTRKSRPCGGMSALPSINGHPIFAPSGTASSDLWHPVAEHHPHAHDASALSAGPPDAPQPPLSAEGKKLFAASLRAVGWRRVSTAGRSPPMPARFCSGRPTASSAGLGRLAGCFLDARRPDLIEHEARLLPHARHGEVAGAQTNKSQSTACCSNNPGRARSARFILAWLLMVLS